MNYKVSLNYTVQANIEPGMDVSYDQYRKNCLNSDRFPVAKNLYPCYEYKATRQDFAVNAKSAEEALNKVLNHRAVVESFGRTLSCKPGHRLDDRTSFFDVESDNKKCGMTAIWATGRDGMPEGRQCHGGKLTLTQCDKEETNDTIFIN